AAAGGARADADRRDGDRGGDLRGERGGDLFEHDREAAGLLEELRVAAELVGLLLLAGADAVGPELVDALRGEPEVTHHRDPGREDALDGLARDRSAFELDGVGAGLLHHPDRRDERLLRVALVGPERE